MWSKLLDTLCPSRAVARQLQLDITEVRNSLKGVSKLCSIHQLDANELRNTLANQKTHLSTALDRFSVTSHAIHQYKNRHANGKGTDTDIEQLLYKSVIKQIQQLGTLPDGKYSLFKGVVGVIDNNTLVTVLPHRAAQQLS